VTPLAAQKNLPLEVQEALGVHEEDFAALHLMHGPDTRDLCYARLTGSGRMDGDVVFAAWFRNYPSLRDDLVRLNLMGNDTPRSEVVWGFVNLYLELVLVGVLPTDPKAALADAFPKDIGISVTSDAVWPILTELVEIGRSHKKWLEQGAIAWAVEQIQRFFEKYRPDLADWIRFACYGPQADPSRGIPRFLQMEPVGPEPYNDAHAWDELDAETSAKVRDSAINKCMDILFGRLKAAADALYKEAAKLPEPKVPEESLSAKTVAASDGEEQTQERPEPAVDSIKARLGRKVPTEECTPDRRAKLIDLVDRKRLVYVRYDEAVCIFECSVETIYNWIDKEKLKRAGRSRVTGASVRLLLVQLGVLTP
jgi:hypothetical protein